MRRRGRVIALQPAKERHTQEADMFDLVRGDVRHIPSHSGIPLLVSSAAEAAAITLAIAVPLLFVATNVPEVPSIIAFVAAAPPPAPPPPAAPRAAQAARPTAAVSNATVIPLTAPSEIKSEPASPIFDEGVAGGVEGGVPGGIVRGVLGGIADAPPAPPPAPAGRPARGGARRAD